MWRYADIKLINIDPFQHLTIKKITITTMMKMTNPMKNDESNENPQQENLSAFQIGVRSGW